MKPVLKWPGGKRWLLPVLKRIWEPHDKTNLVEPFTGGMAVALGLNPNKAILNDANVHLINLYRHIQQGLKIHFHFKNNADYYYSMRDKFNTLIHHQKHFTPEAASIFYFLIRTGFNGLCRFNKSGEFNVPFGQHKTIKYRTDFSEYKDVLKRWHFSHGDFQTLNLRGNEFLYADPPYDVEFTQYCAKGFEWDNQIALAQWLNQHQGPIIASNQATKRILELYQNLKFQIFLLPAPRSISCNGNRTPVMEMLALKGFNKSFILEMKHWDALTYYSGK